MSNALPLSHFHAEATVSPPGPAAVEELREASQGLDAAVYRSLLDIIAARDPVQTVLTRVARLAAEVIPGAAEVSVTVVESDRAGTVAFSGQLAPALDERQYAAGAGPCLHAALSGQLISIDDTSQDTLYPEFSRQAHRHGVKYILAVGLTSGHGTNGAINFYGLTDAGPLLPATRTIATVFADAAGIAVTNALALARSADEANQMREAMASRACIEQAKGIIMARQNCTEADAFEVLRAQSMHTNRKLRDLAREIVDTAADPGHEPAATGP